MGSIGNSNIPRIITQEIKGIPFIYGTAVIHNDYIDIDGYSNKKTIKGALADLAKALDKYNKGEANALRSSIKLNEIEETHPDRNFGPAQYILEYEEVPGATKYSEDGESEYKNARWYLHTRIVR